mgnify:CR=1 FL=1
MTGTRRIRSEITINGQIIGMQHPPFVVAEAGINHNGDIEKAFQMIRVAKNSGVDAVKFQTFKAEEFVVDRSQLFTYQSQGKEVTEPMLDMFKRYEFTPDQWRKIKKRCDDEKILFLSTPQNPNDLALLLELGIPAVKVGSDDLTNLPLLKEYSRTNLPLIISSGMADLAEVHQALSTIGTFEGYPSILLHCTSQYPAPPVDLNMAKIQTLISAFPGLPLGFSDHSQGSIAAISAVALGACFFEKHFTLANDLPGPDHWFSENPENIAKWTQDIRSARIMMGSPLVQPSDEELKMRVLARRSLVALNDIQEGETLSLANIGLRRPGNGLKPALLDQIIGLSAARFIARNSLIQFGDFK